MHGIKKIKKLEQGKKKFVFITSNQIILWHTPSYGSVIENLNRSREGKKTAAKKHRQTLQCSVLYEVLHLCLTQVPST